MDPTPLSDELAEILGMLGVLTDALDDDSTAAAVVRADGRWDVSRDGSFQPGPQVLSAEAVEQFVELIHRHGPCSCLDHWWAQPVRSGSVPMVTLRRRPGTGPREFSQHALQLLRSRLGPGAAGVVFGRDRTARSTLLLNLLPFFSVDFALYVGPTPPVAPDGLRLMEVAPPGDDRERAQLAPIVEDAPAVLFDGPARPADIRLLFAGERRANRWLTAGVSSTERLASMLDTAPLYAAKFDTRIGVGAEPGQSLRLEHLSVRHPDGWEVLLGGDESATPDVSEEETTTLDSSVEATVSRDSSPTNPERPSKLRESPPPDPPDEPAQPPPEMLDERHIQPHPPRADDDAAGDDDELSDSGEIKIPRLADDSSCEEPSMRSDDDREDEDAEPVSPHEQIRGERIDDELPKLVATGDVDDVEIPKLDVEQLRHTREEELDVERLRQLRENARDDDEQRPLEQSSSSQEDQPPEETSRTRPDRKIERSSRLGPERSSGHQGGADRPGRARRERGSPRVIPVRGDDDESRADGGHPTGGTQSDDSRQQSDATDSAHPRAETDVYGGEDDEPETTEFTVEDSEPETTKITIEESSEPEEISEADGSRRTEEHDLEKILDEITDE